MKRILVYTFKNFPYNDLLPFKNIIELKKLNNDIEDFCKEIVKYKPELIIGIAKSTKDYSTIEKYTVNKFNKGILIKNAPIKYELDIPKEFEKCIRINTKPTTSFCNLTMFKIKHFLEDNNINIQFAFIHITKGGIDFLKNMI
jgi:hypothetical protein